MDKLRVGVLISGRGSNLEALLNACSFSNFPAKIALVISNNATAKGLLLAEKFGIPHLVIDHLAFTERSNFDAKLDSVLQAAKIELVCLAGFMRLLTKNFVLTWKGRLLNIHPSLLPSFKGTNTHRQALDAGVKIHGCTVHFVTPELDSGPIIAQAAIRISCTDNENDIATRVLKIEHQLYPSALLMLATGRVKLDNDRVIIDNDIATNEILF
ncbi:MAG: phosphoribosylglycinamide formyltransferase [Rhodospirillaceae bacterium]|jgi:phosphoribosylglycinamide formyltransferase-1|nr:phosphoribosylglycinamide formyltransferase [Rhodospirillaceae bacterium]